MTPRRHIYHKGGFRYDATPVQAMSVDEALAVLRQQIVDRISQLERDIQRQEERACSPEDQYY